MPGVGSLGDLTAGEMVSRIDAALEVAWEWGNVEGEHHVRWIIDQMIRELLGDLYAAWVDRWQNDFTFDDGEPSPESGDGMFIEWDCGIPP